MEEIIYLEPDEEITSVIDKIKNARASSVGLVVPRDATILQSVVNLRLLAKEAGFLGKQIAIVTTDKIGRNLANQVGLPVYGSVKEDRPNITPAPAPRDEILEIKAESPGVDLPPEKKGNLNVHHFQLHEERPIIRWKAREKPVMQAKDNKPGNNGQNPVKDLTHTSKPHHILWPIFVVVLILVGIGLYLLWPAAQVEVFVKSDNLDKSLPLVFTNAVTTPNADQNTFPGVLVQANAENTQKFSATGTKNLGGKATGAATFTNGLDSLAHKFPAGTKLLAQNKTFLLKTAVTVPGATVQNLQVVPGAVTADIEAENPGEEYNIKATKFVISGVAANQQTALYAEAKKDLQGGFTKVSQVVSQTDYDNAKKQMTDSLFTALDQDLKTKSASLTVIDKAAIVPDPEISATAKVNDEATDFQMTVKLTKQVMAYDYANFTDFLIQSLSKQVSPDKMVAIASKDDIGFVIDKQAYDMGELDVTANISAKVATKISAEQIKTAILGKSANQANEYIVSQPGVEKANFIFRPNFWKQLSYLAGNVQVKINYGN